MPNDNLSAFYCFHFSLTLCLCALLLLFLEKAIWLTDQCEKPWIQVSVDPTTCFFRLFNSAFYRCLREPRKCNLAPPTSQWISYPMGQRPSTPLLPKTLHAESKGIWPTALKKDAVTVEVWTAFTSLGSSSSTTHPRRHHLWRSFSTSCSFPTRQSVVLLPVNLFYGRLISTRRDILNYQQQFSLLLSLSSTCLPPAVLLSLQR